MHFKMNNGIVTVTNHIDQVVATIDVSNGGSQEALDQLWAVVAMDEDGTRRWTYSSSMHHDTHAADWEHLASFLRSTEDN
jgi:hypothetical protein